MMTISLRGALLLTAGFGLGYYKALSDSDEIVNMLADLKISIDELVKVMKYGDDVVDVESQAIEEKIHEETPQGAPVS
jgi:hypothetical protein